MEWKNPNTATLNIGVQLDSLGAVVENTDTEIAKTSKQIFKGINPAITAAEGKAAYDALKAAVGYNSKDTDTVVMTLDKTVTWNAGE